MKIGILAIQGGFSRHQAVIKSLGYDTSLVRTPGELKRTDALIIPGGESTTFLNLFYKLDLHNSIIEYSKKSPIMGTCAGLIVLSKTVDSLPFNPLGLIDISVDRNAYGRQKESFVTDIEVNINNDKQHFEAVFIRAPKINHIGTDCKILASFNKQPVLVHNENILVCSFHPELTQDPLIHYYFIKTFIKK